MTGNVRLRAIAYHEAGHCLAAWMYARPGSVRAILTSHAGGAGGFTFFPLAGAAPWQRYEVSLAGPLAAAIFAELRGLGIVSEPLGDDQSSTHAVLRQTLEEAGAQMGGDTEPVYTPESLASIEGGARRRSVEERTLRLLRRHWAAVQDVAEALEAHGSIDARQLTRIMRAHGVERAIAG